MIGPVYFPAQSSDDQRKLPRNGFLKKLT